MTKWLNWTEYSYKCQLFHIGNFSSVYAQQWNCWMYHTWNCTSLNSHQSCVVGTLLVVQWLRLYVSNTGGTNLIPVQGTKVPYCTWHSQKFFFNFWKYVGWSRSMTPLTICTIRLHLKFLFLKLNFIVVLIGIFIILVKIPFLKMFSHVCVLLFEIMFIYFAYFLLDFSWWF